MGAPKETKGIKKERTDTAQYIISDDFFRSDNNFTHDYSRRWYLCARVCVWPK